VVQQEQWHALKHAANASFVGMELLDDLGVEVCRRRGIVLLGTYEQGGYRMPTQSMSRTTLPRIACEWLTFPHV